MRLNGKLYKTSSLIDSAKFNEMDDCWDLAASEIIFIQKKHANESNDYSQYINDMLYDAYKLGFSKGKLQQQLNK